MTELTGMREADPVEIDFGALLKGVPTGAGAALRLDSSASAVVVSLLRPTRQERRTEQPLDDVKFNVIARGPFEFLFDEGDRLVIVSYGSSTSDALPALTEQAMCGPMTEGPTESEGIRLLWDGHRLGEFASLSRFAGAFAPTYDIRLAHGRTADRWLNFTIETPHARLFLDFLHKVVPGERGDYHIDYALSAITVTSRRHLARVGQP